MCDRRSITVLIEIAADSIIRIHKSTDDRIIVSTDEIIQSRFYIIHIPPIPEGLNGTERAGHRSGGAQYLAPSIVGVLYHFVPIAVNDSDDIAL